jgi:hypothetical protein
MAAGRSPFSEVPPKTDCQPRHRPSRAYAPRADADLSARCCCRPMHAHDFGQHHFARPAALFARPVEVSGVIKEHHVRFVYIDPRVSSVSRRAQVAEHSRRQASHRSAAAYECVETRSRPSRPVGHIHPRSAAVDDSHDRLPPVVVERSTLRRAGGPRQIRSLMRMLEATIHGSPGDPPHHVDYRLTGTA